MTPEEYVSYIQKNAARVKRYQLGHDGSDGTCDCIGLQIGALRLAGIKWPGIHGSNWAARNVMTTLEPCSKASQLSVGDTVYKAKRKGESGWSLPSRYSNDPDQNDYYHVGTVTKVNPLVITHCTGVAGGIKRDSQIGKWNYHGKMKWVDGQPTGEAVNPPREEENSVSEVYLQATVTAKGGVNFRNGMKTTATKIDTIPNGAAIEAQDQGNGWCKVRYQGRTGYAMKQFITFDGEQTAPYANAIAIIQEIETLLNKLKTLVKG